MRPENSSVSLRRDLSAVAQEFDSGAAQQMFIGRRVAPIFRTDRDTGNFPVIRRSSFKKPARLARAEGGDYNRVTGEFGMGTFTCEEHGLEYPIDDRMRARYAEFIDAESAATRILRHQVLMAHEIRVAALTLNNASFTQNAPSVVWSTSATAVPIDDLLTGCEALEDLTGLPRSMFSLIIPRADKREMLATSQVQDKVKYTYPGVQPAQLTDTQIAAMLQIRQVLTAGGSYDATEMGVAESMTQIWTAGRVMLALLADGENTPLEMPQLARTMLWTRHAPELPMVESYRQDSKSSDIIRMRDDTDEVLIGAVNLAGYVLTT
jgi:hypothetical protein